MLGENNIDFFPHSETMDSIEVAVRKVGSGIQYECRHLI